MSRKCAAVCAALVCAVLIPALVSGCVLKAGDAAVQRGSALFQQKRFDEARSYFEAALSEERTYTTDYIYILISNCWSQQHDYDAAIDWRMKALEISGDDADNYLNIAFLYRLKKDDATAETLFLKAAELAPDSAAPYASLASLYLTAGRVDEALPMLLKANELDEKIAIVHADLAVCYARKGMAALAEEELSVAKDLRVDNYEAFRAEVEGLLASEGQ